MRLSEPPSGEKFEKMVKRLNEIDREPRAGAMIWHFYLDDLLDWILSKQKGNPDQFIKDGSFYDKVMALETFGVLPKETVANLYTINTIRNAYAHQLEIETPAFGDKCRNEIKKLDWYEQRRYLNEKTDTNMLFSMLANETYHELHKLYFQL